MDKNDEKIEEKSLKNSENNKKIAKELTEIAKKNAENQTANFKKQYFDYYDDIKSHTHKIIDW